MIQAFLASLQPDGEQLLADISRHVSDDMLAEIALADYEKDQEEHFAQLRRLRDRGALAEPMNWHPGEVLVLIRNSEPEDPSWKPGAIGVRGHWMRAFACAALLRAREEPWNYRGDPAFSSFTLIQLIDSICVLPDDFTPQAVRALASIMLHPDLEEDDNEQVVYCGVGLLWLALHLKTRPSDKYLIELAEWIVRREGEIHKTRTWAFDRWLLGIGQDPPPSPWESLGKRLRELDLRSHSNQLQEWVRLIGKELAGDTN